MAFVGGGQTSIQNQQAVVQPERKLDPYFFVFLDSVAQLVTQNPLAFEFNTRYLAHLAQLVFTNRFFEFVQSDDYPVLPNVAGERNEYSKLLSAFGNISDAKMQNFVNEVFSEHGLQSHDLLCFNAKDIEFWAEYWSFFEKPQVIPKVKQQ